jgi:hypothetical protein
VAIDADEHDPEALAVLRQLCGSSDSRLAAAEAVALRAVAVRRQFWDGIQRALLASGPGRYAMPRAA